MTDLVSVRELEWKDYAGAAVLALAITAGAAARMAPGVVGVIDDDAVYAVTATALAEGKGYHLVNLPGTPPQTKYPILYPAVLSVASLFASAPEAQIVAMQYTTTALAALGLAMAYLYCVRFRVSARAPAFAGCLLAASAPNVLFYCSQTLSEMPFLSLLIAALWAVEMRLRALGASAPRDFITGVLLSLPLLCRTAGVIVPVAAVAVLWRHGRTLRWVVAGAVATALPWFLWVYQGTATAGDAVIGYQTDYLRWWWSNGSLVVPATNLFKASQAFAHINLEAFSFALYDRMDSAGWLLFVVGALAWIPVVTRSLSFTLMPVTLLAYLALLCMWPWPPDRFLVPILPFLAAMLFGAIVDITTRLGGGRTGRVALLALFAAVVLSNVALLSRYAKESKSSGYPYFMRTDAGVEWRTYQEAFARLRLYSHEDEVLAAGFDTMTSLYTDRPTVRPYVVRPLSVFYGSSEPVLGTVAEFYDTLERYNVRYLLLSPLPAYPEEAAFFALVYAATDARPGMFRPVWQATGDPRFVIFKVMPHATGS